MVLLFLGKIQAEVRLSNFQNEMTACYLFGWAKFLNIYSLQCHFSLENAPIRNPPNQTINLCPSHLTPDPALYREQMVDLGQHHLSFSTPSTPSYRKHLTNVQATPGKVSTPQAVTPVIMTVQTTIKQTNWILNY